MEDYELSIEYKTKGTSEVNEKSISINLFDYQESYEEEMSILQQQYKKNEVNKLVRPLKEQFIFERISDNLKDNEELDSLIDPLVDEVDEFVLEINEDYYDDEEDFEEEDF